MNIPENLSKFSGNWQGNNRLYLSWMPQSPFDSQTKALVVLTAKGRFLKLEYDWVYDGKSQEGLILIGNEKNSDKIIVFWIDSWHLSDKYMVSEGGFDENGHISVKGSYTVPDNPDWGWRTVFDFNNENNLKMTMFNVSPDGIEDLAVEAVYKTVN